MPGRNLDISGSLFTAKLNDNSVEAHTLVGDALAASGNIDGAMKAYQTGMAAFNEQNKDPRYVPGYPPIGFSCSA